MAQTICMLTFECEPVLDALHTLSVVHQRLAKRHGADFRRLERDVEALFGLGASQIGDAALGPDRFVLTPPSSWTEMIARARAMGIL